MSKIYTQIAQSWRVNRRKRVDIYRGGNAESRKTIIWGKPEINQVMHKRERTTAEWASKLAPVHMFSFFHINHWNIFNLINGHLRSSSSSSWSNNKTRNPRNKKLFLANRELFLAKIAFVWAPTLSVNETLHKAMSYEWRRDRLQRPGDKVHTVASLTSEAICVCSAKN